MSESTNSLSQSDELDREETLARRVRLTKRIAVVSFVVYLLLILLWGAYDYTYTCRIRIPGGTTVVDRGSVREHAGIFDFIFKSAWLEKLRPYLLYRHYVIPPGATEIGAGAFDHCIHMRSIRIPYGVTKIGNYAFGTCLNLREIRIPDSVEA
ncbi:MAG: leucine-rich repeat protein, partial [Lentisphaeria bacterium]|nr:leucine-rich repeat protein [Lentisphaeria bacterium]